MKNKKMYVGADASVRPTSKARQNKGITLIALIITIIVMLILVAVTISMAINGGLFEKAGEAVGETKNEINKEQTLANGQITVDGKVYNSIDDYLVGKVAVLTYDETVKENGFLTANATYTSGEYTAVVPKGFKVIPGLNGSTSISDGLVIQDADGNEFVWIPVTYTVAEGSQKDANGLYPEFLAVFYRSAWDNNNRTSTLTTTSFPSSSDTWSNYTEPYASGYTTESADYYEMMRSVQKNKGFYIGRYEAGIKTTESPRTASTTGSSNMVVQRDCYPYNFVGWGNAMNDYTSDVIYNTNSNNQTNGISMGKGALYLSKHMYDGKDIGATSTLCYGIQWDAMLDFIKDSTHNVTSSKDWGNYYGNPWTITRTTAKFTTHPNIDTTWTEVPTTGQEKTASEIILLTTGADDRFAAKNIYDVAGNMYEWTNEAHSSANRVSRGGNYFLSGSDHPASKRTSTSQYICNYFIGFRPTLYIN
ncbi:MAG: hypothetical protein J6A29_06505 [Clostridia bacterium]|nr:hypothetical protein [Clostridia bacterium]